MNYWIVTCYFFPGWGWYLTEAEAELKIIVLLSDDLSKICLWIINHFTWNDRWSISRFWSWIVHQPKHKLFKQKVVYREEFSSRWLIEDKIFFVIDNEKRNCWSLKIFFINQYDFCKKSKIVIFHKMDKFWGGVFFTLKIDQKWGGLHSLLEGSNTTASPGHVGRPPPQNCRTDTETSWKKGPGLEQPWGDSSGRPVTLIISSISSRNVIFGPPPIFHKLGQIWPHT
jgi:hypothetical protein